MGAGNNALKQIGKSRKKGGVTPFFYLMGLLYGFPGSNYSTCENNCNGYLNN
jgi:hypothetical protein